MGACSLGNTEAARAISPHRLGVSAQNQPPTFNIRAISAAKPRIGHVLKCPRRIDHVESTVFEWKRLTKWCVVAIMRLHIFKHLLIDIEGCQPQDVATQVSVLRIPG